MQKSILIVAVAFIFCAIRAKGQKPAKAEGATVNDWSELELKGKVKSLKEVFYEPVVTVPALKIEEEVINKGKAVFAYSWIFNKQGDKTEERDSTNGKRVIYMYSYTKKGIKTSEKSNGTELTFVDEQGNDLEFGKKRFFKDSTAYNDQGNKLNYSKFKSDSLFKADTLLEMNTYRYNDKGDTMGYVDYSPYDGTDSARYDDKGHRIRDDEYNTNKNRVGKLLYTYNDKGYCSEIDDYDSAGAFAGKITYLYDERGDVIEEAEYKADGTMEYKKTFQFTYNAKGFSIDFAKYKADGSLESKYTKSATYDEHDNETELDDIYSDQSSKDIFTYVYDKEGNWIKRTKFMNDKPLYITERSIKYY